MTHNRSASEGLAPPSSFPRRAVAVLDKAVGGLCWLAMAIAALALLASLGMIVYSVVMRYVLNTPQVWVDDVVGFMLVAIVMLAAADVMRRGEHIGVDLLTNRLGERGRRIAAAWALVAVLVTAVFLVTEGWETVAFSHMLGVMTHGHVEIPLYQVQLLVPIGGALLALAVLAELARAALGEPMAVGGGHAHLPEEAPE